jgi:hypothetical protein
VSLPDCWCSARSGVVAAETADARIRARWFVHQHRKSWPIPLTMQVANFGAKHGGEWAPSRRNLGSLFVCSKQKAATWENGRGAQSFDRDQRLACNHGLAANLHKLLFSSNWLLLVYRGRVRQRFTKLRRPGRLTRNRDYQGEKPEPCALPDHPVACACSSCVIGIFALDACSPRAANE